MHLLILLYALAIGSFLNVCIYRMLLKENIAFPSSYCPNCYTKLKWYDNVPILSYIFILGRCRYCKEKISIQYPLVEILNGIVYLILYNKFGLSIDFILFASISSILIVIVFIDLKEMIIPDNLIIYIFIFSLLNKILNHIIYNISPDIINSLLGLFISGVLFILIILISKGGMGGGDVTLISTLGFILGVKLILLNIILSFILGAIISIFLLIFKVKSKKDPIPFGPFIVLSFFIVLLYGDSILDWYFRFLI